MTQQNPAALPVQARKVKRTWWSFRIATWALAVVGASTIMLGQFWLGSAALLGAAAVRIAWAEWRRRAQTRFDALAEGVRQ